LAVVVLCLSCLVAHTLLFAIACQWAGSHALSIASFGRWGSIAAQGEMHKSNGFVEINANYSLLPLDVDVECLLLANGIAHWDPLQVRHRACICQLASATALMQLAESSSCPAVALVGMVRTCLALALVSAFFLPYWWHKTLPSPFPFTRCPFPPVSYCSTSHNDKPRNSEPEP
jgi:hypothetical protein